MSKHTFINDQSESVSNASKPQDPAPDTGASMLTQTIFAADGSIHTYPDATELGRYVTADGSVSQRGRCVTAPNGETHFMPYREGGRTSIPIYGTDHAVVSQTPRSVIVRFRFPREMSNADLARTLLREARQIGIEAFGQKKGGR